MGSVNQARDAHGRWTAGSDAAAAGAHTQGIQVIKPVRLDNANSPQPKRNLGTARSDRIVQMKATDARHFGISGDVGSRVGKMLPKDLRGPNKAGWPYNN